MVIMLQAVLRELCSETECFLIVEILFLIGQMLHNLGRSAKFMTSRLGLTSLKSLVRDETFPSLKSLTRLFPKVSQNIILFFGMFLAGKCTYIPTKCHKVKISNFCQFS